MNKVFFSFLFMIPTLSFALTASAKAAPYCFENICVGDKILPQPDGGSVCLPSPIPKGCETATVMSIDRQNNYLTQIRCASGQTLSTHCLFGAPDLAFLSHGCLALNKDTLSPKVCVGSQISTSDGDATVLGIRKMYTQYPTYDGSESALVVKRANGTKTKIKVTDAFLKKACLSGVCVGDTVIDLGSRATADVEYINLGDPNFGLRITGNDNARYATASLYDLASTKGCLDGICVGQKVLVTKSRAAVVAGYRFSLLNDGGNYVVRFDDSGSLGSGWKKTDLSIQN
jgi:hypothetical protein